MVAVRRGSRGGFVDMQVVSNPGIRKLDDIMRLTPREMDALTKKIDTRFRAHMRRLYSTEGASGGPKWKKLSPKYKKWKDRQFGAGRAFVREQARARGRSLTGSQVGRALGASNKILQLTGTLKRSLTDKSHSEHIARYFIDRHRAAITLGTDVDYGRHHVEGKIVRDPMQTTPEQEREYKALRNELMNRKLKRMARFLAAEARKMQSRRGRGGGV